MKKLWAFEDRDTASALSALGKKLAKSNNSGIEVGSPIYQTGYLLKTKSSGVAARSGTTAGTDTAYMCYLGDDGTITETTDEADVYNVFGTAIAGSVYITAKRVGNILVIDAEDCP